MTFAEEDDAVSYGDVEEIARRVLLHGGPLLAVRADDVPGGGPLAAISATRSDHPPALPWR